MSEPPARKTTRVALLPPSPDDKLAGTGSAELQDAFALLPAADSLDMERARRRNQEAARRRKAAEDLQAHEAAMNAHQQLAADGMARVRTNESVAETRAMLQKAVDTNIYLNIEVSVFEKLDNGDPRALRATLLGRDFTVIKMPGMHILITPGLTASVDPDGWMSITEDTPTPNLLVKMGPVNYRLTKGGPVAPAAPAAPAAPPAESLGMLALRRKMARDQAWLRGARQDGSAHSLASDMALLRRESEMQQEGAPAKAESDQALLWVDLADPELREMLEWHRRRQEKTDGFVPLFH
jgi:hypothetical protein